MESKASAGDRSDILSLDLKLAGLLARAERALGRLQMLADCWPLWAGFSQGPLLIAAARAEASTLIRVRPLDELLAMVSDGVPSRPPKALRWPLGILQVQQSLASLDQARPLAPSQIAEAFHNLDAPHLAREPKKAPNGPVSGAAAWTLAPRWLAAGLTPLLTAGLALAYWEREGPDQPRRGPAGRVFLWALAPRLGLPAQGLYALGPCLQEAAGQVKGGMSGLRDRMQGGGGWKEWLGVFLAAAAASAEQAVTAGLAAQALHQGHAELITTWAHAPNKPLALLDLLFARPVLDLPYVAAELEVTQRTAGNLVNKLKELALLSELTGKKRGRKFGYTELIALLDPSLADQEKPAA